MTLKKILPPPSPNSVVLEPSHIVHESTISSVKPGVQLPVQFPTLIRVAPVPAALVVALIGPLHSLADPQLLHPVLVHLSLGQEEAQEAGRKANHPRPSTDGGNMVCQTC